MCFVIAIYFCDAKDSFMLFFNGVVTIRVKNRIQFKCIHKDINPSIQLFESRLYRRLLNWLIGKYTWNNVRHLFLKEKSWKKKKKKNWNLSKQYWLIFFPFQMIFSHWFGLVLFLLTFGKREQEIITYCIQTIVM